MIAADFLAHIEPIDISTSPDVCAGFMFDLHCDEIPVFKDNALYGRVELDECIHSQDDTIEGITERGVPSVLTTTHLFDVLRIFNEAKTNTCAVLTEELEFTGVLSKGKALEALSRSISIDQEGAIIVLEAAPHQYSSSEIARIVEGEGAQILGLWLEHVPDSGRIRISLKLNTKNAERIIGGLRRFNYEVIASFGDEDYKETVEKRYQSLIKYLDL